MFSLVDRTFEFRPGRLILLQTESGPMAGETATWREPAPGTSLLTKGVTSW